MEWTILDLSEVDNFEITESSEIPLKDLFSLAYSNQDLTKIWTSGMIRKGRNNCDSTVQPNTSSYPFFLSEACETAVMDYAEFKAGVGKWRQLARISPAVTGFPRNHNPGLRRNCYGQLDREKGIKFYYTVSLASPEVQVMQTYAIWRGSISEEIDTSEE